MVEAWHFVNETLRDGSPVPPDGETIKFDGQIELCARGYHASERIIDALKYSPGNTICRVKCGGAFIRDYDKFVCSERTIIWRIDGESILRDFARRQALTVAHLMPDVVRQYLETGDESLRVVARAVTCYSAQAVAACDAAWAANWTDAGNAAWGAVCATARVETRTWDDSPAAQFTAPSTRAWAAANETLTKMINEAHNG